MKLIPRNFSRFSCGCKRTGRCIHVYEMCKSAYAQQRQKRQLYQQELVKCSLNSLSLLAWRCDYKDEPTAIAGRPRRSAVLAFYFRCASFCRATTINFNHPLYLLSLEKVSATFTALITIIFLQPNSVCTSFPNCSKHFSLFTNFCNFSFFSP